MKSGSQDPARRLRGGKTVEAPMTHSKVYFESGNGAVTTVNILYPERLRIMRKRILRKDGSLWSEAFTECGNGDVKVKEEDVLVEFNQTQVNNAVDGTNGLVPDIRMDAPVQLPWKLTS